MNPLTAAELASMTAAIESTMGSDTAIGFSATVATIPAGSDPTARTTVISSLKCRNIRQLDEEEKERANMASVTIALRCECEVNALIKPRQRLIVGTNDYRIDAVVKHPAENPRYYMLYLEADN